MVGTLDYGAFSQIPSQKMTCRKNISSHSTKTTGNACRSNTRIYLLGLLTTTPSTDLTPKRSDTNQAPMGNVTYFPELGTLWTLKTSMAKIHTINKYFTVMHQVLKPYQSGTHMHARHYQRVPVYPLPETAMC